MITREGSHHKTWRWLKEQDIRNRNYCNGRVAGPPHGTVEVRAGNQVWPYILWAGGSRAVTGPAPGSPTRPCRRCTRFRRSTKTREGQEKTISGQELPGGKAAHKNPQDNRLLPTIPTHSPGTDRRGPQHLPFTGTCHGGTWGPSHSRSCFFYLSRLELSGPVTGNQDLATRENPRCSGVRFVTGRDNVHSRVQLIRIPCHYFTPRMC